MPAIDLSALWDFDQPALSEARFRERLATASPDDAAILQTQIARTLGLRRRFDEARAELQPLADGLAGRSPEAQARWHLEWGRSWVSGTHSDDERTPEARDRARAAYREAEAIACAHGLDDLAIDALHMLPFVDPAPAEALAINQQALALARASAQPAARRWIASLQNNTGMTLHALGRYDEALALFEANVALANVGTDVGRQRIARWMVAWTLRALGQLEEALAMQRALEQANAADGTPDPYVFEELAHLSRASGDEARALHYDALQRAAQAPAS